MHFSIVEIIKSFGLLGIIAIVFAESGLFFGFFLPGDSLLFTAGFLASQGFMNIWGLAIGSALAAIIGDNVGYTFGHKIGPKIFNRPNSKLFNKEHLVKAHKFYEKHGPITIVLARFMPLIRTFAPIVAGAANMEYSTFMVYNLAGGVLWASGMSILGYLLGNLIPGVDKYLLPIVGVIIVVSVAPGVWHYVQDKYFKADKEILEKSLEI